MRTNRINGRLKLALAASAALTVAGSAYAGTINFGGRTWNTYDQFATAQYSPGQWNDYWVNSNNSGSMRGRFGVDTILTTPITAYAGAKISYDYVLTNDNVDLNNDGASQWIGDNYASFRPDTGFYPSSKVTGHTGYYWYRDLWFSDPSDGGWTNAGSTSNSTGVHFEWNFTSDSTYTVSVWNAPGNPSGAPAASYSSSLNGGVGAVQAFRISLWDSEQTSTVSNFKSRPTVPAQSGNTFNWIGGSGDYNTGGNWLGGSAPTLADHATIANGGTATVSGSGVNAAHVVTLAIGGVTGSGTVNVQPGGELFSANSIRLGTSSGTGTLNQTGGLVAIDMAGDQNLRIGHDAGGTGYYNLSGGELWVGDSLTIGKDGTGTLTMTGGWISHAGFITVGRTAGSNGTFNMSGGVVDQSFGDLEVGNFSTGTATFSGGTFNVAPGRAFAVGNRIGGTGVATINGSALIKTSDGGDVFIGGNDNTVTDLGGTGTLNINGGELQVDDDFIIGNYGNGTLNMTNGLVSKSGWIVLGNNPGGHGTMNMSGGTINQSFGDLEVGDADSGNLVLSGGDLNIAWSAFVGKQSTGVGTVTQTGGTLTTVASWGSLTIANDPGASGTYNLSGGTLNTPALNNNGTFNFTGGNANVNVIDGTGNTTVGNAASLAVSHVRQNSLSISGGANVTIAQSGGAATGTSVLNSLNISSGKLDLKDNHLIVKGAAVASTWNGSSYGGVAGLVASGYNGGTQDGNGIVTSMPDAVSPNVLTQLVTVSADDAGYAGGNFGGQSVSSGDQLVMYTWGGDANLDGTLNGDDYFQIDSHFNQDGLVFGYYNGDFNYDGAINGDDYFIIDSNWNAGSSGTPFPTSGGVIAGVAAVPEPTGFAVLAGVALLAARRRRIG